MVNKEDCIYIFNAMIRGTPVPFKEKLLPLISDYLTEIKYGKSDLIINLIVNNPQLIARTFPTIIDYYCRKYCILCLKIKSDNSLINNFKTILYYE